LGEQLVKNLAFIAKVVLLLTPNPLRENDEKYPLSIRFMLNKLNRHITKELQLSKKDLSERRMWSFKLMAVVAVEMPHEALETVLEMMVTPLCREVTDKRNEVDETRDQLVLLAQQVLDVIKTCIGEEKYCVAYAEAQLALRARRMHRKKEKALQVSSNNICLFVAMLLLNV